MDIQHFKDRHIANHPSLIVAQHHRQQPRLNQATRRKLSREKNVRRLISCSMESTLIQGPHYGHEEEDLIGNSKVQLEAEKTISHNSHSSPDAVELCAAELAIAIS